jgi:hypothetical protein
MEPRPAEVIPQPAASMSAARPDGDLDPAPIPEDHPLYRSHLDGVLDFLNPRGFGFVKDRRHVAGFQSHQFSNLPGPPSQWELRTLDLISLQMHETPVAYVSSELPRMDALGKAPVRPLDSFESAALGRLVGGEDLVVGRSQTGMRMVGSIRSTKGCIRCHEGQRGELLGAFSYTLQARP